LKGNAVLVAPEEGSFKLLTPTEGRDALTDYTFNTHKAYHSFCPRCGIRCFLKGMYEVEGQKINIKRICVSTLDEREDGEPSKTSRWSIFSHSDGVQGRRTSR
jgi:hypothetical protein